MKAKILISFYRNEGGHKAHRVYLEPHFEQAQKDLEMIQDAVSLGKDWELQECEVYNWKGIDYGDLNDKAEEQIKQAFIKCFEPMQKVEWEGLQYWVIEDNGGDKVLVANADYAGHPDYNDWWVNRDKLNAL